MRIKITTKSTGSVTATLSDENPDTAKAIFDALPITGHANLWGDEIYFSIPVDIPEENGKTVVEMGDIAYWPPGKAFCIFFGLTPVSDENVIRPASEVNVIGKIDGDPKIFMEVDNGEKISIEKA